MQQKKNEDSRAKGTPEGPTPQSVGTDSVRPYTYSDISSHFWINGSPPTSEEYKKLAHHGFRDWSLLVYGLVGFSLQLSLQDIRMLPKHAHVIPQNSVFTLLENGTWTGVPLVEVLKRCEASPEAQYVVFSTYQLGQYNLASTEVVDRMLIAHTQAILAYEVNGTPLSIEQGAPLRLQIEIPSGLKVVKYLRSIELTADDPRTR